MTSVPPTQPPAAPESDVSRRRAIQALDCNAADLHSEVKLTAAEEDAIENAWVAAPKDGPAASRDPMYAAVERIVAERLRVVEGERDAARADHHVVHQSNDTPEIVCSCGVVLSVYGLTRSLASVFGEHVRTARALLAGGEER